MFFCIILIILSIVGTIFYKSDRTITGVILTLLTIIFVAVYGNADTQSYLLEYQSMIKPDWSDTEPLWMLVQFVFRHFDIPFWLFRCVCFLIGVLLIKKTIDKITCDKNVILLFYAIYPFMMDCVQLRNFVAMSILIFGLGFLVEKNKKGVLRFCVCVILCSLIHNVFIIYIFFVFIPWVEYRKFIVALFAFCIMLVFFMKKIPTIALMLFGNYHNGTYANKYVLGGMVSMRMTIALLVFYMLNLFLLVVSIKIFHTAEENGYIEERYKDDVITLIKVCMAGLITFVLNLYSMDFARIYRDIIFITYALVWQASYYCRYKILLRIALVAMIGWGLYVFVYYPYSDTVFWPTLHNNHVFEYLSFDY